MWRRLARRSRSSSSCRENSATISHVPSVGKARNRFFGRIRPAAPLAYDETVHLLGDAYRSEDTHRVAAAVTGAVAHSHPVLLRSSIVSAVWTSRDYSSRRRDTVAIDPPRYVAESIDRLTGRTWLLPKLLDWWDNSQQRLLLLKGGPGTGKSMILAWLANHGPPPGDPTVHMQLARLRRLVKAAHFCQASSRNLTPQAFAESIADQLTGGVTGFGDALAATLADRVQITATQTIGTVASGGAATNLTIGHIDLSTLGDEPSFDRAFVRPLKKLYERGHREPMLLLVDALDEAQTYTGKITLPRLLSGLADLPPGVRILAATRDDPDMLQFFRGAPRFDLIRDAPPDVDDVREYAVQRLKKLVSKRSEFAERLAKQAQGIFLYAALVLDDLLNRPPSDLPDLATYGLPEGLSGIYHDFLKRELGEVRQPWSDRYRPLLGLVAVAQGEGLSSLQLASILNRDLDEIGDTLRRCKQYLSGELPKGPFRPFHKTFADFLLEDEQNIDFHIDAMRWHKTITDYYRERFSDRWADLDAYGAASLLLHAIGSGNINDVDRLIENVEFLIAAEPDLVMRATPQSRSDRARDMSLAYGHVANLFRDRTMGERRSYLEMSLLQNGIPRFGKAGIAGQETTAPWRPVWATCEPTTRYFPIVGHREAISAITSGYLGDRAYVASGDTSGEVRVSNLATGAMMGLIPDRRVFGISALASYSQSNELMIVIGDNEGMIECWDLIKTERLWGTNGYHWHTHHIIITSLEGRPIMVSCSKDAIYALDIRSGKELGPFGGNWNTIDNNEKFGETYCLASYVAAHRTYLLSGHGDGVLRVWDLQAGKLINKVKVDDAAIRYIQVIERDGKRFIVSAALGRSIRVLDRDTLECISHTQHQEEPNSLPGIAVGELGEERVIYSVDGRDISVFAFSDGRKIAETTVVNSGWIRVIARARGDDGAKILLGCNDRCLYVIDENELFRSGHRQVETKRVTAISSVNVGGNFLACGHADGSIRLRDPDSGQVISGHEWRAPGAIRSIEFIEHQGDLILGCRFEGGVWICHNGRSTILADADRSDSVMSMALGVTDGQPVMAIGTDSGNIETYGIAPEVRRLGGVDGAHTWRSANRADPQVRPSNISALAIVPSEGGTVLASAGWEDMTLALWHWATLNNRGIMPTRTTPGVSRAERSNPNRR